MISPTDTTSAGFLMCVHDNSELCTIPSTPPRSTNAPYDVSDFTSPSYCFPISMFDQNSASFCLRSSLCTFRIDATARFLPSLTSIILALTVLSLSAVRSPSFGIPGLRRRYKNLIRFVIKQNSSLNYIRYSSFDYLAVLIRVKHLSPSQPVVDPLL